MHKVCLRHLLFILISITFSEVKADTFTQATAGALNEDGDRFGRVLATGDFNGDGFDDLVASAPYEDTSDATDGGILFIFYGSLQGLSNTSETITQNSIVTATNEDGDRLGWALAVGNFNGDEYEDLAVGVPYEDTEGGVNAGMVAILFGSAQGLLPSSTEAFTQDSLVSATNEAGDKMGWSLAAGNFNGDNYDDLAIGIPYENTEEAVDAGLVGIFFGSEQGLLPSSTEALTQNSLISSTNEDGDLFGYALAAGNFNGDAYDDLAVGIPGEDTDGAVDTGLVGIFFGSAQGLLPSDSEAFTQNSINRARNGEGDQMGNELAVGDFNNDNYDDLAIGVAYEDDNGENAGSTYIMYGSGDGLLPATGSEAIGQTKAYDTNEKNDLAGSSLATGDFDGDGFDDLIIGVPQEDIIHSGVNSGTIQAFFGSSGGLLEGLDSHRSYWAGQVSFGGSENAQDQFGFALAVGDFDNNGKDGLAVGAPNKRVDGSDRAGAVYVQEIDPALPMIDARAAIVMDRNTGEILGSKMPDLRRAMASTTKIMTALLAVEAIELGFTRPIRPLELDDLYTISENAAAIGGSSLGLSEGDQISLRDLLYGTMLPSGNDAAIAVAEAVSGSEASFVLDMNLGALRLGLTRTAFQSPHGRDPGIKGFRLDCPETTFEEAINLDPDCSHFSTARDLARLANFALNKRLFRVLVSTPQWTTTTWANGPLNPPIVNGNGLIKTSHHRFYAGAYGVKTGTTDSAGGCLVFAAERSGVDLVGVVLGSDELRYTDSTTILDFAFDRAIEVPLRLQVNTIHRLSDGANLLNISFPAHVGRRYRIEKSTNLLDWEPLETGIQGSGNIERNFPTGEVRCFIRVSEEER
jgi:D-alanyl-D-alanine carboxypeptidase